MIVLTILSSIFANSAIDKVFDRAESFANGYVEENEKYDEDYTYEIFETTTDYSELTNNNEIVFNKDKYKRPTIFCLNKNEFNRIVEGEAFYCGKIDMSLQWGNSFTLSTDEGKTLMFEADSDDLPENITDYKLYVCGIQDSEDNVFAETIYLIERD